MTKETAIIRRAREIISDPERWTQGASARDEMGDDCPALFSRARSWCAWGALVKAASEATLAPGVSPIMAAEDATERIKLTTVRDGDWFELHVINDNPGGHAAVLALFDKALASEAAS